MIIKGNLLLKGIVKLKIVDEKFKLGP